MRGGSDSGAHLRVRLGRSGAQHRLAMHEAHAETGGEDEFLIMVRHDGSVGEVPTPLQIWSASRVAQLLIDPESGYVLDANPAAEMLLAAPDGELRGATVASILPRHAHVLRASLRQDALAGRNRLVLEDARTTGACRDLEAAVAALYVAGRRLLHVELSPIPLGEISPAPRRPTAEGDSGAYYRRVDRFISRCRWHGAREAFALVLVGIELGTEERMDLPPAAHDRLLDEVGSRLELALRPSDFVVHLPGGRFALILPGVSTQSVAASIARRLHVALSPPVAAADRDVYLSMGVGVALSANEAESGAGLHARAMHALEEARASGPGHTALYDGGDTRVTLGRIGSNLQSAWAAGELEVLFVPVYELRQDRIIGLEAQLFRRASPRSPAIGQLLVLDELSGAADGLEEWALRTACAQVRNLLSRGLWPEEGDLAIRLSTAFVASAEFINVLCAVERDTGFPLSKLRIEVGEEAALRDSALLLPALSRVRNLGARVRLGDFGIGPSSLLALRRLAIDEIRLDRQHVQPAAGSGIGTDLFGAITTLARSLNLEVVVSGTDDRDLLPTLRAHGCTRAQGRAFAPPLTTAELATFLVACLPVR